MVDAAGTTYGWTHPSRAVSGWTLLVAGGGWQPGPLEQQAVDRAAYRIGIDSGAGRLLGLGIWPDLAVGDFDSLPAIGLRALERHGVPLERVDPHKDETDGELGLRAAARFGVRDVVLLGWVAGERPDQAQAGLGLLADPAWHALDLTVIGQGWAGHVLRGPARLELACVRGAAVSLVPVAGPARGIRTAGLEYPLDGEDLPAWAVRGVSNVMTAERATVTLEDGVLLAWQELPDEEAMA